MGEELVEHWAQLYNLPTISLRFFNVYGARSRTSGTYGAVFGVFLAQKLSNKPYTVVGDGNQTRDFTYVTDIVSALVAAAESSISNQIYNVGSDTTVSINKIVKLLGGDKVYIPKRPGEPDCTYADISKIKNDLGWCPTISIEEGIDKILEDINYWNEATVWEPKSIADATSDWFKYLDK
jgi:UDP-glucose 4-epimerase